MVKQVVVYLVNVTYYFSECWGVMAGKTHTMEGPSLWEMSTQGVIPRTVDKLFCAIREADIHTEFTVSVSYFEVSGFTYDVILRTT